MRGEGRGLEGREGEGRGGEGREGEGRGGEGRGMQKEKVTASKQIKRGRR